MEFAMMLLLCGVGWIYFEITLNVSCHDGERGINTVRMVGYPEPLKT